MKPFDLSPLYRTAIGVDRLANLFDEAMRLEAQPSYPPYNVELVGENNYMITMAVAGFDQSEISIETENATLKVTGRKQKEDAKRTFLHRGIAARDFEQRFKLADHIKAVGARMENGMLNIELVREIPEALKPRKIEIGGGNVLTAGGSVPQQLENTTVSEAGVNVKPAVQEPVAA